MSYQVITDFRGGLDVRKYKLTLPPGTLTALINGHITAGGEIEKRKAFVKLSSTGNTTSLPAGTFDSLPTSGGVLVFGSTDLSASNFPTGFSYQRLQHPAVLAGNSYDGTKHAMTAVIFSRVFGSYAFVVAQFADGYQFAYYNGALVNDFTAGLVLPYIYNSGTGTNIRLAKHLAGLVNNTLNYTAIQAPSPNDNSFDVYSQPGNNYNVNLTVASASNINVSTATATGYPIATISATDGTNAGAGSSVSIGGKTYTFKAALTTEGDVLLGATINATLTNLFNAINHTGTPGTDYNCAAANANVLAQNLVTAGNPNFQAIARVQNTAGLTLNTIAGATFALEAATTAKQISTTAQGQFQVVAFNPSIAATGTITATATNPVNGHTITIGGKVYRFEGTMTQANDVKIGASANATLDNLILAINGTPSGSGSAYYAGTTANAYVTASARNGSVSTLTAILAGTGGNAVGLTQSNTDYTLSGATLAGGITSSVSGITAGPIFASGTLTTNRTNPSNNDSVTIGATTYTFKTTLTTEGDIQIGASYLETLMNLIAAINQTGVQNFNYKVTSLNAQVTALATLNGNVLEIIARAAGVAGNSISLAVTGSTLTTSAGTLTGGADTVQLLASAVQPTPGQTLTDYAISLVNAINAYSGTSGYSATKSNQTIFVTAVAGNSFSNGANLEVTTTGQVAIGFCIFKIIVATVTSSPTVAVAVDGTTITSAPVAYSTDVPTLCTALASNINAGGNTNNNGVFVAVAQGSTVYLSRVKTNSSDYSSTVTLAFGGTGLSATTVGAAGLTAVVAPTYIQLPNIGYSVSAGVSVCKTTGGYPPYSYSWQYNNGDSAFSALNPNSPSTNFARTDGPGAVTGTMVCKVTDSQGNVATSNPVTLYQP
jgi:hypothetical protein